MKKMFFIIVCAALTAAASFACGCAREGTGWSIDEDAAETGSAETGSAETGADEAETAEAGAADAGDARITVH
ncbi:MAG: hypothetical protein IJM13_05735, partial [Lachnospiraceae bacterium]|nr:hypothetical protein [Lachnospiraceae bacterium]